MKMGPPSSESIKNFKTLTGEHQTHPEAPLRGAQAALYKLHIREAGPGQTYTPRDTFVLRITQDMHFIKDCGPKQCCLPMFFIIDVAYMIIVLPMCQARF